MKKNTRFQLAGWILFLICAGLFIASGYRNRDPLTFIGSIVFFAACLLFIIPLLGSGKPPDA